MSVTNNGDAIGHPRNNTPISLTSDWTTIIPAGNLIYADNGGSAVQSTAQIAAGTAERYMLRVGGLFTHVLVRAGFVGTVDVAPTVQLFGVDNNGSFGSLVNAVPTREIALADPGTSGDDDGTTVFTIVTDGTHRLDCEGYQYIVAGVKTALTGTNVDDSWLEVKGI